MFSGLVTSQSMSTESICEFSKLHSFFMNSTVYCRMPVTPVSAKLFDSTFAAMQWPILTKRLESIPIYPPACSENSGTRFWDFFNSRS